VVQKQAPIFFDRADDKVPDQAAKERVSVLVVDDEPVMGDALRLVLESSGFEVIVVETGRKGITEAGRRRFGFVIVDLFLSDISGLLAIKTMRERQPDLMIILITAQGTPQAFAEARRLGVIGILRKPFPPADLLDLIFSGPAR
jgi:DNA-binding response OmpR family regulator